MLSCLILDKQHILTFKAQYLLWLALFRSPTCNTAAMLGKRVICNAVKANTSSHITNIKMQNYPSLALFRQSLLLQK